jgi:hypothetical protein
MLNFKEIIPVLEESQISIVGFTGLCAAFIISLMQYVYEKKKDRDAGKIAAARPFLELRQKLYLEALHSASVLASKEHHTEEEIKNAKKRFMELYWGELSLVEERRIEALMIEIARKEGLVVDTNAASYKLAHAMRDSLKYSWGISQDQIGRVTKSYNGKHQK